MKAKFIFGKIDKVVEIKMNYESWLTFMSVLQDVACGTKDSETWANANDFLDEWNQAETKTEWYI